MAVIAPIDPKYKESFQDEILNLVNPLAGPIVGQVSSKVPLIRSALSDLLSFMQTRGSISKNVSDRLKMFFNDSSDPIRLYKLLEEKLPSINKHELKTYPTGRTPFGSIGHYEYADNLHPYDVAHVGYKNPSDDPFRVFIHETLGHGWHGSKPLVKLPIETVDDLRIPNLIEGFAEGVSKRTIGEGLNNFNKDSFSFGQLLADKALRTGDVMPKSELYNILKEIWGQ